MNNNLFLQTAKVLDSLIDLNLKFQLDAVEIKAGMPKEQWLRYYCTIKFDVGARTGKTQWAVNHTESNPSVVLFCPNTLKHTLPKRPNIISNLRDLQGLQGPITLIVDEFSYVFYTRDMVQEFYLQVASRNIAQIILLN